MANQAIAFEQEFIKSLGENCSIDKIEEILKQIFHQKGIAEYKIAWINIQGKEDVWLEKQLQFSFETKRMLVKYGDSNLAILYYNGKEELEDCENIVKSIIIHCYFVLVKKSKSEEGIMKKDLEVAAKMQQLLIPNKLYCNQNFCASGLYLPNYEVGGDFYDVIHIADNKIGFCIGDISGKGINAAIVMAHFIGYIRTVLLKNLMLEDAIKLINEKMYELAGGEKFITLFLGIYNTEDKRLVYVNSGHLPIPIYNENSFEWLETGTTILGMFKELPFVELGKIFITEKTKLFLYTDGLLNLNIDHQPFLSNKELAYLLNKDCQSKSPLEIIQYFKENIKTIDVDEDLKDDISILAVDLS